MRFPLPLVLKIASSILWKKLQHQNQFATVLQLEPLHTCNLTCTGCGRIREYSTSLKNVMPLADCLAAAKECDAPMVSICGGEPLIYPEIEQLVAGLLEQRRIVYICTNGLFMRKKMRSYLAWLWANQPTSRSQLQSKIQILLSEQLITPDQAREIENQTSSPTCVIKPSIWLFWNVHLDGLERTHDLIVEREGVFRECIAAIRMAKILGFQVATNTTIYRETDMAEIEQLFDFLSWLDVDGHTISPGYDYDAAKEDMRKRLGLNPEDFFLTRPLTRQKFRDIEDWAHRYRFFGTPAYFEFLAGKRELTCSAWAIPTRNILGWKAPCYVMSDYAKTKGHYPTYKELLENVNWDSYGVKDGVARDPRCENCMMHCGFEPTATLGLCPKNGDLTKLLAFNFGPRPRRRAAGAHVKAFNGVANGQAKKNQHRQAASSNLSEI